LDDIRKERDKLRGDVVSLEHLRKEIDEEKSQANDLKSKLNAAKVEVDDLRQERLQLQAKIQVQTVAASSSGTSTTTSGSPMKETVETISSPVGSPTKDEFVRYKGRMDGQLSAMQVEVKRTEDARLELQQKVLQMSKDSIEKQQELDSTKSKVLMLEQRVHFIEDEKAEFERRFISERQQRQDLQQSLDKAEMAASSHRSTSRAQQDLLERTEEELAQARRQIAAIREDMSQTEATKSDTILKLKETEAAVAMKDASIKQLQAELNIATASAREFREKFLDPQYDPEDKPLLEQHKIEKERLIRQLSERESDLRIAREELNTLATVEENLRSISQERDDLKSRLEITEKHIISLQSELQMTRSNFEANESKIARVSFIESELNTKQERIAELSRTLEEERQANIILAQRAKDRKQEVDDIRASFEKMENSRSSENDGATNNSGFSSEKLKEIENKNIELKDEITRLEHIKTQLQTEMETSRRIASETKIVSESLSSELEITRKSLDESRARANRLSHELGVLQANARTASVPISTQPSLSTPVSDPSNEFEVYRSKVDAMLAQQNSQVQVLQQQIKSLTTTSIPTSVTPQTTLSAMTAMPEPSLNMPIRDPVPSSMVDGDANFESVLGGLVFNEPDKEASMIRDVIMDYVRRRREATGRSDPDKFTDEKYWKQKVEREKNFLNDAKLALQRDKEIVKWSQTDLSRRKDAWRRKKNKNKDHGSSAGSRASFKLLGEAINRKTSELNRMVNDIRWTQNWLQERERKLSHLERLIRSGKFGGSEAVAGSGSDDAETPQKLSMLDTEMESDLTFFELSHSQLSDCSDDDYGEVRDINMEFGCVPTERSRPRRQNRGYSSIPKSRGTATQVSHTYKRDAWTMPPSSASPLQNWKTSPSTFDKENVPRSSSSSSGTKEVGTDKLSTTSALTASAVNARSEIQKFTQKCLETNEAYDQHATWLSSLRSQIGKSVWSLHSDGSNTNVEREEQLRKTLRDATASKFLDV